VLSLSSFLVEPVCYRPCVSRDSVILRFGNFVGDDPVTRWRLL